MRKIISILTIIGFTSMCSAQTASTTPVLGQPLVGAPFDEIIVESNLNVRKKPEPAQRRTRSLLTNIIQSEYHRRQKRQYQPNNYYNSYNNPYHIDRYAGLNHIPSNSISNSNANSQSLTFGNPDYSSSASQANANSFSHGQGPNGFGSGSALAQAQGFQSVGPLGNFGATSANSNSQNFQAGLNGAQGASGLANSQSYTLPNGRVINLALTNSFSSGLNGQANSRGNAISIT